jgi:hypothetical protein
MPISRVSKSPIETNGNDGGHLGPPCKPKELDQLMIRHQVIPARESTWVIHDTCLTHDIPLAGVDSLCSSCEVDWRSTRENSAS